MKIQRFKGTFLRFRRTKGVNFRENSACCGTVFACRALVTIDFGSMGIIEKLRMRYLYRGEWREKYVTLESVWKWMRSMVSQWRAGRDALYGAQMVLMLVGGQG